MTSRSTPSPLTLAAILAVLAGGTVAAQEAARRRGRALDPVTRRRLAPHGNAQPSAAEIKVARP